MMRIFMCWKLTPPCERGMSQLPRLQPFRVQHAGSKAHVAPVWEERIKAGWGHLVCQWTIWPQDGRHFLTKQFRGTWRNPKEVWEIYGSNGFMLCSPPRDLMFPFWGYPFPQGLSWTQGIWWWTFPTVLVWMVHSQSGWTLNISVSLFHTFNVACKVLGRCILQRYLCEQLWVILDSAILKHLEAQFACINARLWAAWRSATNACSRLSACYRFKVPSCKFGAYCILCQLHNLRLFPLTWSRGLSLLRLGVEWPQWSNGCTSWPLPRAPVLQKIFSPCSWLFLHHPLWFLKGNDQGRKR